MAIIKSWEAHDVEMKRMYLEKVLDEFGNPAILGQRDYVLLDEAGQELPDFSLQVFSEVVLISDIPANILSALQTIDNWFYNRIVQKVQE